MDRLCDECAEGNVRYCDYCRQLILADKVEPPEMPAHLFGGVAVPPAEPGWVANQGKAAS